MILLHFMKVTVPEIKKYGKQYELKVDVISVQTNQDETGFTASVRFTKTLHSVEANRDEQPQYYIASIRYEYAPNNLNKLVEKDLIKNPFGFKVVGYRVDPELSPSKPVAQATVVEPNQRVYVPIQQGGAGSQAQQGKRVQAQQGGASRSTSSTRNVIKGSLHEKINSCFGLGC